VLLGVDALDELASGVPSYAAPEVQQSFRLSYGGVALLMFVVPAIGGMVLEPIAFVLADRYPRKWFVCGGLFAMGALGIGCGFAPSAGAFAVMFAAWAVSVGVGVSLAQATLMDAYPADRERMMTRWVFMGNVGDLLAPLVIAGLALASLGWRAAFIATGALVTIYAAVLCRLPFPPAATSPGDDEPAPRLRDVIRGALRNRRLLLWLTASWLCSLLDEILVVFASLHLRDDLGAGTATRSAILACFVAGALVGLVITDRILAVRHPVRVLRDAAVACAISYTAWVFTPSLWASAALLFATGCFCAPMYPIAKAQAYRALPGHSGTVNAVDSLFGPASIALPFALGLLADHAGLTPTLLALAVQPVALAAIATYICRARDP
jgi:predicted MFS family arabinose efflux permease